MTNWPAAVAIVLGATGAILLALYSRPTWAVLCAAVVVTAVLADV